MAKKAPSIEDFTLALKADFFDNCYLQQNAFDEVDAATPAERQKFVFAKVLEVIDTDFQFSDKSEARQQLGGSDRPVPQLELCGHRLPTNTGNGWRGSTSSSPGPTNPRSLKG